MQTKEYIQKYRDYLPEITSEQEILLNQYFLTLNKEGVEYGYVGKAPSEEELWLRHIGDCLFILQNSLAKETLAFKDILANTKNVYDIGSGAGLPGIVLAIMNQHSQITLVDSMQKRIRFTMDLCKKMNLTNVNFICSNVEESSEELSKDIDGPDVIVFRAFRKPLASLELILNIFKKLETHFCKVLYWRSRPFMKADNFENPPKEIERTEEVSKRILRLGYEKSLYYPLKSPGLLGNRGFYFFEYTGSTHPGYPRSWARIKKDKLVERTI